MERKKDVRWKQRFTNYQKALSQLQKFLVPKKLNELEEQGLIKAFEYTYELAWNVMRDYLRENGFDMLIGSRDAIMCAFREKIIDDGEEWMNMFRHRNLTVHAYNEDAVKSIATAILDTYIPLFNELEQKMKPLL
jgi:nucleotidyltransferase substrate binding protein (TIGR01987 family)